MSGDRLAEIEERCEFFGQHSGWVTLPSRDVLALVEIARLMEGICEREFAMDLDIEEGRSALARLDSGATE